jgi:hypothetical protein
MVIAVSVKRRGTNGTEQVIQLKLSELAGGLVELIDGGREKEEKRRAEERDE